MSVFPFRVMTTTNQNKPTQDRPKWFASKFGFWKTSLRYLLLERERESYIPQSNQLPNVTKCFLLFAWSSKDTDSVHYQIFFLLYDSTSLMNEPQTTSFFISLSHKGIVTVTLVSQSRRIFPCDTDHSVSHCPIGIMPPTELTVRAKKTMALFLAKFGCFSC